MESSDDEMDLIERALPTIDITPSIPLNSNKLNDAKPYDSDEEVMTSDPDELAMIMANRSLEGYPNVVPSLVEHKRTNLEVQPEPEQGLRTGSFAPNSPENLPTPLRRTRSRPPVLAPSSSPTQSSQCSTGEAEEAEEAEEVEEDMYTDASGTSQLAPPTSSPDSIRHRYSPPQHLLRSLAGPTEHPETELTSIQSNENAKNLERPPTSRLDVTPLTVSHVGENAGHPASAMSLDSWHSDSMIPLRDPPITQSSSPLSSAASLAESFTGQSQAWPHPPNPLSEPRVEYPSGSLTRPSPPPEVPSEAPHRRTLRARTVRQQHPYAIEYAQYKRSMLQAGLNDAIVKFQMRERHEPPNGNGRQPKPLDPEMQGFIVPEDEESQDVYIPPPSPPPRNQEERLVKDKQPSVDIGGLLERFGGMLSDDETPALRVKRKNKGKEKEVLGTKISKPRPKPFPRIGTDIQRGSRESRSPSSGPQLEGPNPRATQSRRLSSLPTSPSPSNKSGNSANESKLRTPRSTGRTSSSKSTKRDSASDSELSSTASTSGSSSVDSIERKRLRILNRMMPAAWVRRQMEQTANKERLKKRRALAQAGTTGTKRNVGNLHQPLVLKGDSESGEEERSAQGQRDEEDHQVTQSIDSPPRAQTPKRPRVFPRRRNARVLSDDNDNDIVEISSSDGRSSPVSSLAHGLGPMDDDEISTWLTRRSPKRSGGGGDLINRMLSRTSGPVRDFKRGSRKSKEGYGRHGAKLKQAKLTSMFRASSPDRSVIELSSDEGTTTRPNTSRTEARTKAITRKRTTDRARSHRTLTIRGDLAELLDATIAPNPGPRKGKDKKAAYNRAASTSNLHIREGHGPLPRTQNSSLTRRPLKSHAFNHKSVSTDCGILPFKPHTKFSPSTYIGRGFLQNLLDVATAANAVLIGATPVVVFGEHLDTRLSGVEFVEQVRRLVPRWAGWLLGKENEPEQNVQRSFRFVALRITYLLEIPPENVDQASFGPGSTPLEFLEEDAAEIFTMINAVSQDDPALKDASLESNNSWLSFHWFVVELAVRIACGNRRRALHISDLVELNSANLDAAVQLLIRALLGYSISDCIQRAYGLVDDIDDLVLELWLCLLYLIDETEFAGATRWKPLWARVESILDTPEFSLPYKVFESERRWEHIFAFSALNAFSCQTGRLLPSQPPVSRWPWVCKTIKDIRLKEDGIIAGANARQQRIDFYVRTVTARCWLLHTMWGWNYRHHDRLFTLLHPIFQSRKLAKLRDEKTDFPAFIRHLDLEHLGRFSHGDTAWSMFLKIFRRTVIDDPGGARKLYSICTPIGVLNFTNENPATDLDLSRLLNRFAIFLVILITNPTQDRAVDCIKRVQALISFQAADMRSREACIRAFQYTGLLLKFYKLDLAPLVAWMRNIIDSLRTDLKKSILPPQRNRLAVLVLCLVRSVAAIVSTSGFARDSTHEYPEITLLTSDLIQVMFELDLKNNAAARREIRLFLEAFCHAREALIATLPPKPTLVVVTDEESQESYGFDDFEIDLNDPEVLAGLDALEGETTLPANDSDPLASKEKHAAELINNTISPAIFEHIILGFGLDDRRLSGTPERGADTSEEYTWLKVWVGCLKIVVENHQRTWWDYLSNWGSTKQERISRIIDIAAERRVRIQFCYLALKCSPYLVQRASKEQKHQLILPWFQCLPHHRYTIEHKYTALICDRGLTSDPILEGLPCRTNDKGDHYVLSTELMAERVEYVKCALTNLARLSRINQNISSSTDLTRGRSCIAKLFETMKHTWEHLNRQFASSADQDLIPSYLEFCHGVRRLAGDLLVESSVKDLYPRLAWVPAPA